MGKRSVAVFAAVVGLLTVSAPLAGHHANAVFDVGKRVTVKGTVTEWFWANPHCLLRFDVKDDKGQVVHWVAETQAPPNMIPWGWSRQSFKAGDEVIITLEPVKSGEPLGRILQAVLSDGRTLVAGGPAVPAAPGQNDR
jgi:uncharacterized protein DUF6152